MSSFAPDFKAFNLALIQLGQIGADKAANLKHAKEMILTAARAGGASDKKPSLVVLPVRLLLLIHCLLQSRWIQECFNSPYGHVHFPVYAETIGFKPGKTYNVQKSSSESVRLLSETAKEAGIWLIGGPSQLKSWYKG